MAEIMKERKGSAFWNGKIRDGSGTFSTQSGALREVPYSFLSRFEDQKGSNPEELIGAAHAGCFSMALSLELEKMGLNPDWIYSEAKVSLEKEGQGWRITRSHLEVKGNVPGATEDQFQKAAKSAKENCPVSRALNLEITMNASLVKQEEVKRPA